MSGRIRSEQIKDDTLKSEDIKDESVESVDIKNESVYREDLNVSTTGKAVIRKIIAGERIEISETGVDSGTGDVIINVIPKYRDYIKRADGDGLINQTTTAVAYIDITFTVPRAGIHKVTFDGKYSINGTGADFEAIFNYQNTLDPDVDIQICRREGKDAGGAGVIYPNTTGGNTNTGTDQTHDINFMELLDLPAGDTRFRIQFRCANFANQEAAFHRGLLTIEEWEG